MTERLAHPSVSSAPDPEATPSRFETVGRLAAGVAHEINTPIQFIGDNLRFLEQALRDMEELFDGYERLLGADDAPRGEAARAPLSALADALDAAYIRHEAPRAVRQAIEGVERVAEIVVALRELSHPGSERGRVDLNRALKRAAVITKNEWKYVAELDLELDPDLPVVECVPAAVDQAVLNLVINAAHAIADRIDGGTKGRITLGTRRCGADAVEISVRDDGCGMSGEVQRQCFEPFYTTKDIGRGTGQGLARVHDVVEAHGGTIVVESTPDLGSCFRIRLPIACAEGLGP